MYAFSRIGYIDRSQRRLEQLQSEVKDHAHAPCRELIKYLSTTARNSE